MVNFLLLPPPLLQVFTYAAFHDVWTLPADACDFSAAGASQLAATDASPFSYTLDTAGDFYFGCNIASHCASGGMLLEVKVAEGGSSGTPSPEGELSQMYSPTACSSAQAYRPLLCFFLELANFLSLSSQTARGAVADNRATPRCTPQTR